MTYCLALKVNDGIVFGADTRTNAGVDYVTSYRKIHVFDGFPDRFFVLLSAGNLGTSQEVLHWLRRDLAADDGRESLATATWAFEAADYVGRVSRAVQDRHQDAFAASGIAGSTSLILGGQIAGRPHGLFLIYPQGNFIEASEDTPYLQIGENKYGKPALDRIASPALSLADGARLCIVSLDATARSNVTVGPPFEVVLYPKDTMALSQRLKLAADVSLLAQMSQSWNAGIRRAFDQLPRFDWELAEPGA